jgi:SAM-dependent methyltransferase
MDEKHREFDQFARDYREIHSLNVKISGADSSYFCEHKIREIRIREQNDLINFLDFGCGDGLTATFFRKYFPDGDYTGIDVSEESIREATKRSLSHCRFMNYEGSGIPFETGSFDAVMAANVFHHIPREKRHSLISEIQRVLRPGGRFYLFEHNPLNPITQYIVKTCVFDRDAALLWPWFAKRLFIRNGFRVKRLNYLLFFPRIRLFKWLLPVEKHVSRIPVGAQYLVVGYKGSGRRAQRVKKRIQS